MEKEALIKIVSAAQQGDSDAVNMLFNTYYSDVYYFVLKTVKDADLAQDVTQETFVEVINTLSTLKEPAAFVTWMKQIAYHQCTRYFRKKKDVLVSEDEDGNTVFDTVAEENSDFIPDEALDKQDFKKTVLAMLDELSEEQRAATILYYFDELSVREIAKVQGVSEGTVKSRLNYARKSIKAAVNEYEKKNGVKLHAIPFIPMVKWLFAGNTPTFALPASVAQGVTAATGVGITATATAGVAGATGAVGASVGTAVGIGAKLAAAPLAAKVAAIVLAATVAVGGGAAGTIAVMNNLSASSEASSSAGSSSLTSSDKKPQLAPAADLELKGTIPPGCVYTTASGEVLEAGDRFPEKCTEGDIVTYGDFWYGYECVRDPESEKILYVSEVNGDYDDMFLTKELATDTWYPMALDREKERYGVIVSEINGSRIKGLYATFLFCNKIKNLDWLTVPKSAEYMVATFAECSSLKDASGLRIPSKVNNICGMLMDCDALVKGPKIPENIVYCESLFYQCTALTGQLEIDCNAEHFDSMFGSTVEPIDLTGSSDKLYEMAQTGRNGNVTVNGEKIKIPVKIYGTGFYRATSLPRTIQTHQIDMSITDPHLAMYALSLNLYPFGGQVQDKDGNYYEVDSPFIAVNFPQEQPLIPQHPTNKADEYYKDVLISDIELGNTAVPADVTWDEIFANEEYFEAMNGVEYNGEKYIIWQIYAGGGPVDVCYFDYDFSDDGTITLKQNPDYYDLGYIPYLNLKLSGDNKTIEGVVNWPSSGLREKVTFTWPDQQ